MSGNEGQLTFKFIFPEDYNPVYANGVHGEVTPRGEFVLHFVQERRPVPKAITHAITEDGRLGQEIERDPKDHGDLVIKYVTTGVTLNYSEAKSIHAWLGNMLEHFEKNAGIRQDASWEDSHQGGNNHGQESNE
jgi:hypothetical protein